MPVPIDDNYVIYWALFTFLRKIVSSVDFSPHLSRLRLSRANPLRNGHRPAMVATACPGGETGRRKGLKIPIFIPLFVGRVKDTRK